MNVEMTGLAPMLKTQNLPETIAFYTETLGFALADQMEDDAGNLTWCSLECGAATVMFYASQDLDSPPGPPTMTGVLYFNPADVQAAWEQLKDVVTVEWELQEMPYGMLEFAIRDCNGYILSFGREIVEEAGS